MRGQVLFSLWKDVHSVSCTGLAFHMIGCAVAVGWLRWEFSQVTGFVYLKNWNWYTNSSFIITRIQLTHLYNRFTILRWEGA